jgi:hypothetical protein
MMVLWDNGLYRPKSPCCYNANERDIDCEDSQRKHTTEEDVLAKIMFIVQKRALKVCVCEKERERERERESGGGGPRKGVKYKNLFVRIKRSCNGGVEFVRARHLQKMMSGWRREGSTMSSEERVRSFEWASESGVKRASVPMVRHDSDVGGGDEENDDDNGEWVNGEVGEVTCARVHFCSLFFQGGLSTRKTHERMKKTVTPGHQAVRHSSFRTQHPKSSVLSSIDSAVAEQSFVVCQRNCMFCLNNI